MADTELFGNSEQLDDMISRAAVVDAIEGVDWYHINKNGEMVHGANDAEHQAWYKADDIYAAIERVPSAQPVAKDINVPVKDCISRQAAIDVIETGRLTKLIDAEVAVNGLKALPSAQPEQWWIPCENGEPDEDTECWITVKTTDALYRGNFTKRYGERRDKGFITSGGFMWWNTALAWMPIYEPEPYRTEGDDNHD